MQVLTSKTIDRSKQPRRLRLVPHESRAERGLGERLLLSARNLLETCCNAGADRREERALRVVETLQLGPKKQLLLVSCKGERFLVGMGAENVQTIVRLRRDSAADDLGASL